jgi:hypothetical protein
MSFIGNGVRDIADRRIKLPCPRKGISDSRFANKSGLAGWEGSLKLGLNTRPRVTFLITKNRMFKLPIDTDIGG